MRLIKYSLLISIFSFFFSGCRYFSQTYSNDVVVMELYYMSKADVSDTTSFSAFKNEFNKDDKIKSENIKLWKQMRILFSSTLGKLGYGTGPFDWQYGNVEQKAIRKFQKDMNLPITGYLDSSTILNINIVMKGLTQNQIYLPHSNFYFWPEGLFASGTWKAIKNRLGFPINSVDIYCDRRTKTCDIVQIDFISKELDQISMHRDFYDIVYWTDHMIIAKSSPISKNDCKVTITFDIQTKEILWTQICPENDFLGKLIPEEQMTLKLVNPSEFFIKDQDKFKEVRDEIYKSKNLSLNLLKKNYISIDKESQK